jgi:hypothetical protein
MLKLPFKFDFFFSCSVCRSPGIITQIQCKIEQNEIYTFLNFKFMIAFLMFTFVLWVSQQLNYIEHCSRRNRYFAEVSEFFKKVI